MTIEKWLADVYYDEWGNCIWNKGEDGSNNIIADIRGWGVLQYEFVTVLEAEKFHDEVGEFIVQAIKEKLSSTSSPTDENGKPLTYWGGLDKSQLPQQETYESKGSEFQQVDQNNPVTRGSTALVRVSKPTSSQTEISDESWEGCDGCTEQDEVMYKNGYVKGYNAAISELPKEISDEEIKEFASESKSIFKEDMYRAYFIMGAKWYRERLKI
jgi:hypothetical protein